VSRASTTVAPWYAEGVAAPEPDRRGRAGPSVPGRHRRPEAGSELTAAATLSTIHGMWKPRKPRVGDEYVTGSLRDGILMIVVILAAIVVIWLAYGWALGVPGVPAAP